MPLREAYRRCGQRRAEHHRVVLSLRRSRLEELCGSLLQRLLESHGSAAGLGIDLVVDGDDGGYGVRHVVRRGGDQVGERQQYNGEDESAQVDSGTDAADRVAPAQHVRGADERKQQEDTGHHERRARALHLAAHARGDVVLRLLRTANTVAAFASRHVRRWTPAHGQRRLSANVKLLLMASGREGTHLIYEGYPVAVLNEHLIVEVVPVGVYEGARVLAIDEHHARDVYEDGQQHQHTEVVGEQQLQPTLRCPQKARSKPRFSHTPAHTGTHGGRDVLAYPLAGEAGAHGTLAPNENQHHAHHGEHGVGLAEQAQSHRPCERTPQRRQSVNRVWVGGDTERELVV